MCSTVTSSSAFTQCSIPAGLCAAAFHSTPFHFIRYGELRSRREGAVTLAAATKAISQAKRRYAKSQLTWFRKESTVHWLPGIGDDAAIAVAAERLVAGHLRSSAAP